MRIGMLGPSPSGMGGIATVVTAWTESEALARCDVRYFATMSPGNRARKLAIAARSLGAVVSALGAGFGPALFHVHVGGATSLLRKAAFLPLLVRRAPVLVHVHGSNSIEAFAGRSPAHHALVRRFLRQAAAIVTVSDHMAAVVREWVPDRPVHRLYNPVDRARFDRARGPRPERPTVVYMGELVDRKGVFDLLDAAEALRTEIPGLRVRLCGRGPHGARLEAEVRRRGLSDTIELPGWLTGDDWLRAFADAHVFCLPSYSEGLPVSVIEAMAAGLPVVATSIAGIPECAPHGEAGLLHAPGDVDALAGHLRRLLSDPALRDRMAAAGRRRVETTFDREVVARELELLWRGVAAQPGDPR